MYLNQWSDMESKENVFEGVVNNIEEERSQQTLQSIVALLMLWEPSGGWDNVWKTLGTVFMHLTIFLFSLIHFSVLLEIYSTYSIKSWMMV